MTGPRRRTCEVPLGERMYHAYARCSQEEYEMIRVLATKDALSISDFVRRCINGYLLDLGEETLLLHECRSKGPR